MAAHRHTGWFCCQESLKRLSYRVRSGRCAAVKWLPPSGEDSFDGSVTETEAFSGEAWCLTHGAVSDYGHFKDMLDMNQRGLHV